MDEKEEYIQWFLQNNPTASQQQAELSYFTEKNRQDQTKRGYVNPDGTLNSFMVDNVDEVDARRPFGFYQNGRYYGPTVEDYIKDGLRVGDKGSYDIRTDKSNFNEELKYLNAHDKVRGYLKKNPNTRVVAEYVGKPNIYNQMFNLKHAEYIKAGKLRPRYTGNDRHVITVNENGILRDVNLDMIPSLSGGPSGVDGLRGADYGTIHPKDERARNDRWRTISDEEGNVKPNYAKWIENERASEKIKINPDGTITHYNTMKYHIPEVEAARKRNAQPDNLFMPMQPTNTYANGGRLTTRKDDNIFSPAHIFADGGEMFGGGSEDGNEYPLPKRIGRNKVFKTPITEEDIQNYKQWVNNQAAETLKGKYGNGEERKKALGVNYKSVQRTVNDELEKRRVEKWVNEAMRRYMEGKRELVDFDENPRTVIRADGEEKRHIGETDKYDIYL